jgi:hypothetical protein
MVKIGIKKSKRQYLRMEGVANRMGGKEFNNIISTFNIL